MIAACARMVMVQGLRNKQFIDIFENRHQNLLNGLNIGGKKQNG